MMKMEAATMAAKEAASKDDDRKAGSHGKEAEELMSDDTVAGLLLLSLVFAVLAVWVLCRAAHKVSNPPVTVVWRLSLLVCGYLALLIGVLFGVGARAVLFRVSYPALAALAVGNRLSTGAGIAAIFAVAVCQAGFFGYYVAVYKYKTSR